jgi:hypothetical protein
MRSHIRRRRFATLINSRLSVSEVQSGSDKNQSCMCSNHKEVEREKDRMEKVR